MFQKEKIKDLHYVLSGVLTAGEIMASSDVILLKYGEKAKIPGFRPGHVPLTVLRQKYGMDADQDAINELMNKDLDKFCDDKKIRRAGRPEVKLDKFIPGGDAEYTVEFDILPSLPKIDLEKFTLTKKEKAITDQDIADALANIQKTNSEHKNADSGYKLTNGDIAIIDFTGYLGDDKFDGGEGKNHSLTLGSGQFIPGFEDQIIGHVIGDELDVNVTFPTEYHAPNLAGKNVRFRVKINDAKISTPAELNDGLAKKLGIESVDKLREQVRDVLTNNAQEAARAEMRNELLDLLADKVKMDVPAVIVNQEIDLARQNQKGEFDEKKEQTDAERRVKLGLILAEWGNANNISISREDLQSAIWAEAARYPDQKAVFDFYNKNQQAVSMLNGMLFERKTLDAMIEKCRLK